MWAPTPYEDHLDMFDSTIAFRSATADDERVLRDLSELDSAAPVQRPAVLAVVDGQPVAAVSLADGRIVADPFTRTEDVVTMLRARVAALAADTARRRRLPFVPRLRPAA
jgi:hypothetical protein